MCKFPRASYMTTLVLLGCFVTGCGSDEDEKDKGGVQFTWEYFGMASEEASKEKGRETLIKFLGPPDIETKSTYDLLNQYYKDPDTLVNPARDALYASTIMVWKERNVSEEPASGKFNAVVFLNENGIPFYYFRSKIP